MGNILEGATEPDQFEKIRTDVLKQLKRSREQFPERYPQSIHVLTPVAFDLGGLWERCLREAQENYTGERVMLIPFNVRDIHWIGVVLKFDVVGHIHSAECIDPAIQSTLSLSKLQKEFSKVYPLIALQSRKMKQHDDLKQSADLTIENLLAAAENTSWTLGRSSATSDPSNNQNDDVSETIQREAPKSSVNPKGNTPGQFFSGLPLSETARDIVPRHSPVFSEEPYPTARSADQNPKQAVEDGVGMKHSGTSSRFEQELEHTSNLESDVINSGENNHSHIESYEVLRNQLGTALAELDISNEVELASQISEKKSLIQALEAEGKNNVAQKRKTSLSELEKIQVLANRIQQLRPAVATEELETLKNQLRSDLYERDIGGEEELKRQINEKRTTIQKLEIQGKNMLAQRRRDSLSELEQLQKLADRINHLLPVTVNDKLENLSIQSRSGLTGFDINEKEEVEIRTHDQRAMTPELKTRGENSPAYSRRASLLESEYSSVLLDENYDTEPSRLDSESTQTVSQPESEPLAGDPSRGSESQGSVEINRIMGEEFTITEESLRNMYEDLRTMPSCSERSIRALLFYLSVRIADNEIVSNSGIEVLDQLEDKVMHEFEYLKNRIREEEMKLVVGDTAINACDVHLKNRNWRAALDIMRQLHRQINPLDMSELFRLAEKVDDAAKLIKGKAIILFLGGTGVGKSTTMHFLGGSKMVNTVVDGLNHIAPTEIKNPDLKSVRTAPFSQSVTRYIAPVTVRFRDAGLLRDGSIVLCDSPGFEDTSGPEVDIANGIGIVRAIRECRSVKPVILISFKSIGDRCEGVKKIAHVLVGMIPSIKDHMRTFSYLFTKVPVQDKHTITSLINDVGAKLTEEEKSDTSFSAFLKDIPKKTKRSLHILDPIYENADEILDELLDSYAIEEPQLAFDYSISQKSKSILREQVRQDQWSIISATKRSDYIFVQYKLDQLRQLNNLIEQDDIVTIYKECVDFIHERLSQEYQESISHLNGCLLNQTTLSDEDIQRYQASINHFQLAEGIRTKHLDKRGVHSDAFLQNLIQRVDSMSNSLKAEEIDDASVKAILDKMRSLSKHFPNVTEPYENARRLFIHKINFVVNSFHASAKSNRFPESASFMTKVKDACDILKDHIGYEKVGEQYEEMKKYILKHLRDSASKLDDIFIREKLVQNDIDDINHCASILESITQTYALRVHIPERSLNETFHLLLMRVVEYFKGIVDRLNIELGKENAFVVLEQYMAQLDLIRKITVSNSKTSELYYSTLEKLLGYVNESRREIEQLLNNLFGGETNVDFDQLNKHLISLKSAKWIEKYRSGVYVDVIDLIEGKIIDRIILMKESVIHTSLGLSDIDKLENAGKLVFEINEMRPLEKFTPSVTEHIAEVNHWLKEITTKVFARIGNSFNTSKWAAQQYLSLDFDQIDRALIYLETCAKIPSLPNVDCLSILVDLREFLHFVSNYMQKEMMSSFERIKKFKKENHEQLREDVEKLACRLQDISLIKTKYPRILLCFGNSEIMDHWSKDLSEHVIELSTEMASSSEMNRTDMLNTEVSLAKALSKLDRFVNERKYIDIYREYQKILFSRTHNVAQQVLEAIKKHDYQLVAFEITSLQVTDTVGAHFCQQAKRAIHIGLSDLMDETKNRVSLLGENMESEIKPVVDNLKKLQKAKEFLADFLDTTFNIDEYLNEIKQLIQQRIQRFINSVTALITVNNFYEADRRIDSITLVRTVLGRFCTDDVSEEIEALKTIQSKVVLIDLVKKYSEMDISQYTLNPPRDIFAKFSQVSNLNPVYLRASNNIKETINGKFREELDRAKSKQPPSLENAHIRRVESAVKYLPIDLREDLEAELKYCKEDIAGVIRDNKKKFENACSSGDLKTMKSLIDECRDSEGMKPYFNQTRELILKNGHDIAITVKGCFEQSDVVGALSNVKRLHEYKIEFENAITDVRQPWLEVAVLIKTAFEEAYLCFLNRFSGSGTSVVNENTDRLVEKSFLCLMKLIEFSNNDENKDKTIVVEILPEGFKEKLRVLNERVAQYCIECQGQYQTALLNLDLMTLKDVAESARGWNSLLLNMRKHQNVHPINDDCISNVFKSIAKLTPHAQLLESIVERIEELKDELVKIQLINDHTREFKKQRDEFYKKLSEDFSTLSKAIIFMRDSCPCVDEMEKACLESLAAKITSVGSDAEKIMETFLQDSRLSKQENDDFNCYYNNMVSFDDQMTVKKEENKTRIAKITKMLCNRINAWKRSVETEKTPENFSRMLIMMKRTAHNFPVFKASICDKIDEILADCKASDSARTLFSKVGILLNQDENGVGQSIVGEHTIFQGYALSLFNEKTQKHKIDYILQNLNGDSINIDRLRKRYTEFDDLYTGLVKKYLKPKIELDQLFVDIKLMTGDVKQRQYKIEWDATVKDRIPKLVAHVFALWTLKNAYHYFEAEGLNNKASYLLQPHAAQVITIFRMLGIGDAKEELSHHLVQMRTGEGKSVTLGITASILALLGFDIYCACYSDYLSQRDYTAFATLFDSLGIAKRIHYGTFNSLCEHIIHENGSIRELVEQLITEDVDPNARSTKTVKCTKILLIDEVDTFFNRDFYGSLYTPSASLRDPTITSLVSLIWAQRKSKLNLSKVKATEEYKYCCARYPKWTTLIEETVKDMLSDVNSFESHNYLVKDDKVGYVVQDNVVCNVFYGYKTLFAYHAEHERGTISKTSLQENICMMIKCGNFSYAEIPLRFQYIMGVTGTLQTLSSLEKEIIEKVYKIYKKTITPSVFGNNNLRFMQKDDIKIENSDNYHNVIRREIDERLTGASGGKRAVLIFFESEQKLNDFYESKALESIKDSVLRLIEVASSEEKQNIVKRATGSGQIALFTRIFGRGTDFLCYDSVVSNSGGIHVIQTFLSEELSEEVQIKGRTARQGDFGSYSMILLDRDLEKFHIEVEDIEKVKMGKSLADSSRDAIKSKKVYESMYDFLNEKRTLFFKTQYEANRQYVDQARERHKSGEQFLSSLQSGNIDAVRSFLIQENKGVEGMMSSRTVFLMDATVSMSHLLQKCKNTINVMFERAAAILRENSIRADLFEIQLVMYRNYCCREDQILQSSPWETKPDNLRGFMNTIDVRGGLGNEAIEIGLWHANQEHQREGITQVILIGDAAPNTKADVDTKRNKRGDYYWANTKFSQRTYYEDELTQLKANQIPVHAFFVAPKAESSFRMIANKTGGRCERLDIESSAGSELLTNLVTEEILRNVGGCSKGNDLVEAYRNKFAKTYAAEKHTSTKVPVQKGEEPHSPSIGKR